MDNIYIIVYAMLILTSYTWAIHYEYPYHESEYDEEWIENSDEMLHHKSYDVEAHGDDSSHQSSNHDVPNDEKHEEQIRGIHDHQHLKNNQDAILDGKGIETKAEHVPHDDKRNEDIDKAKHANEGHLAENEHNVVSKRRRIEVYDKHYLVPPNENNDGKHLIFSDGKNIEAHEKYFFDQQEVNRHPIHAHDENNNGEHHIFSDSKHIEVHERSFPDQRGANKHPIHTEHDENKNGDHRIFSDSKHIEADEKSFPDHQRANKHPIHIAHDENNDGKHIEVHEKLFPDERGTNKHPIHIAHDENKNGGHHIFSDRKHIEAQEKLFSDQRGTNKHPIHIVHDENNDGKHHIFSDSKHIDVHEKYFPDQEEANKHPLHIVHDENNDGEQHVFSDSKHIEANKKHFVDQQEENKYTTQTTHDERSNGDHDYVLGERKIEENEKRFSYQLGTNIHTTHIAHDENKDGNNENPHRFKYDIIVGGTVAHEEHVSSHHGRIEHTTQMMHTEFLDENKKYLNKGQQFPVADGSRSHKYEQHVINQGSSDRDVLKIEHKENSNFNEEKFFNRREHSIILGENNTEIPHLLIVHDGRGTEIHDKHATNIDLNSEDSKGRIKVEGLDERVDNVSKRLHNTTAFENPRHLKEKEHDGFSSENKDGKNTSDQAALVKSKQSINERNHHSSNDPVRYEPDYFGLHDYHDLLSQVTAFKDANHLPQRNHGTESPSVNLYKKSLNIKEETTPSGTTLKLPPSTSLSPISHSNIKYSRLDLTSNLHQKTFPREKTTQRAKILSVTHQPSYSNGSYLKEAQRMELTFMFSTNSEYDKAKYAPFLTTPSQFPSTSSSPIFHSLTKRARTRTRQNTPYYKVTHQNTPYHMVPLHNTPFHTVTNQNTPYPTLTPHNAPFQTITHPLFNMLTHQNTPYRTVTQKNTPYYAVTQQNTPYHTVTPHNTPFHRVTHQNTPYHTLTHKNTSYQTVTRQNTPYHKEIPRNNLYQSKTTQNNYINTTPSTITRNYLKKSFKTASASFTHPVSHKTKVTFPLSITSGFYSSSSSPLNSQDASEHSRRLHSSPYLHLYQTKTTQQTKFQTTSSPLSTLKPTHHYVIMCKTINAIKFDSQPLVFRRRSNPVLRFSLTQRRGSFPKKKKFVSTPQPPTMALYKVQKVEIGPRDYTVCDYHHYTTKSFLYKPRNLNISPSRHTSTPSKVTSNDYAHFREMSIESVVPKIHTNLRNVHNSENLHGKTFNTNYRRKIDIHINNQNWQVTKDHFPSRSNVYEYITSPRRSVSISKQFFTNVTVTLPTLNKKHKTVIEKLSEPISEFVTPNFKPTTHKNGFHQVRTKKNYKASSNFPQTTASLYSSKSTKNMEEETIFPFYSTKKKSIRRTTLKPKLSIPRNKPTTLFPDPVIAKRNQGFRKSTAHYSVGSHPYLSTSNTERITGHTIFPYYSTEDNTFRKSQESEGFTSYNKPITYFSYSEYGQKERTENKSIIATFSNQEPFTNDQKSGFITTATESTKVNTNIHSAEEYATILNKKNKFLTNEVQVKASKEYKQTTFSVYYSSNEEHGSRFTSMKHKPLITHSSMTTPEKLHSTSTLPLLIRTSQADKEEHSSKIINYGITNNSTEEIHPRNSKQKNLSLYSKESTSRYLSTTKSSFSSKSIIQNIDKNKFYYLTLNQRNIPTTKQIGTVYSPYTSTASSYTRDNKISNAVQKEANFHNSNQKHAMLITPSTIKSFNYNSKTTWPSTIYELKRGETKSYSIPSTLQYLPLVPQNPKRMLVGNPSTIFSHQLNNKPTPVDDKNKETGILLSPRMSEKNNILPLSHMKVNWLCYRSMHFFGGNNCSTNQQQTEKITNNLGKTFEPAVMSTSMHYRTDVNDKEYSTTTANSNILQTTALSNPPRRTENIGTKAIHPFYSTVKSSRQNILEPAKSTSQNTSPITLFSPSVVAKRNQRFRRSTTSFSVSPQPYLLTSKKLTTGHAMLPSYSTEQNTYGISQESEGLTPYIKIISKFSHSAPTEKRRTRNKKIKTTFSQREPFTNAQKPRFITTATESTHFNLNIHSTGKGVSISDKKHMPFISEDRLKTSENHHQTKPSVYHGPNGKHGSHFTSMKYKSFSTYSSLIAPDNQHSTTILPLLHQSPLTDNGKYSPSTLSYKTTNNAKEETQPRNFKRKNLPQEPKMLTNKYLSLPFSSTSSPQTIHERKFYYQTLFQKNTVLSTKQSATLHSPYATTASSYTRDYKIANIIKEESYSHSSSRKPTILMTPSTIKPFDYLSPFTSPSSAYKFKKGGTREYFTPPISHYQSLTTRKPTKVFVSNPPISAFTHPFINTPTTVQNSNDKGTDMLIEDIQTRSDIMLLWLCYRNIHLGKNNQSFNFSQQQTEQIMNSYCKGLKPTVVTTPAQHTTDMTDKDFDLDNFNSHSTSSNLNPSTVSPSSYLPIDSHVMRAKHSKGHIVNARKPEEYVSILSKSRTRFPPRIKVDNFQPNYPHLTMTNSDFLSTPLFLKKYGTYAGHYSNKATEAYSSFTPEPSDSSTIQLPPSNIHSHKFSTLNNFNHQTKYILEYFPSVASSFNHYATSPSNLKNTLKLRDIHKIIFSNTRQNYLTTQLYIPYTFKKRITTSSSNFSSVEHQQKSSIPKFAPKLKTIILEAKNDNPTIKFSRYITRQPTKKTLHDFIYKNAYNRNSNNSKYSSKLYLTNLPTAQNNYLTSRISSYITRQPAKLTSLDAIYKRTYIQNTESSTFSSRLYATNFSTLQNGNSKIKLLSYVTRQPTKLTSLDSIHKTTFKQGPNNLRFSTTNISRKPKNYSARTSSSYSARQLTKSTSYDSVYKTTDAENPNLISKSLTKFQKTTGQPARSTSSDSLYKTTNAENPNIISNSITAFQERTRLPTKSTSSDSVYKVTNAENPDLISKSITKFQKTTRKPTKSTSSDSVYRTTDAEYPNLISKSITTFQKTTRKPTRTTSFDSVYKTMNSQYPNLISKSSTAFQKTTPLQKQNIHSVMKHRSSLKTTRLIDLTPFNFIYSTSYPKIPANIVNTFDILSKTTPLLKEDFSTRIVNFVQQTPKFLDYPLDKLAYSQIPGNIFTFTKKIDAASHSLEPDNNLNTKYFNYLTTKKPILSTFFPSEQNYGLENHKSFKTTVALNRDIYQSTKILKPRTAKQWTIPTLFTPDYITNGQKLENIDNYFGKIQPITTLSKQYEFSTVKPIPYDMTKFSIHSNAYTSKTKDIPKFPKYPNTIIQDQHYAYLTTKPLVYFGDLHPTVDTTDPLSNTEFSLKSDKVLRYTKKISGSSLLTEPTTKSLYHLTDLVSNTRPSPEPETVLRNPELSKEVSAVGKFNYFSTRLPLYLRLKETIRRKSAEGVSRQISEKRFTVNMPEFTAENQNETLLTQQKATELNVAQQNGERRGRRRGGGRGRPGRGRGSSGFKTSGRLKGRPTKTKD